MCDRVARVCSASTFGTDSVVIQYYASEPSPTTILAIYQEPDSARELMKASPFTFTLLARQRLKNITSPASLNILDVLGPVNPDLSEAEKDSDHPSGQKSEAREFQLIVDKSTMDHSSYIRRQQFYWGYSKKQMSSIAQDDLLKTVPLKGLACINANVPEMPHRLANKMTDELRRKKSLRRMWEERDTEVDR